jgi:Protein of unknown function (DUF3341)
MNPVPVSLAPASAPAFKPYGIGAEFDSAASLLHAAEGVRAAGYKWWDTHAPVAIHGIDQARGSSKSWVSAVAMMIGLFGLLTAISLQVLTAIPRPEILAGIQQGWFLDLFYPIVVSGKPYYDWTGNFPINAVLLIQMTGYGSFVGFLLFTILPRWHNPVFNWNHFCTKGSNDGFFIIIEAADPRYEETQARQLLANLGGTQITIIPREEETA